MINRMQNLCLRFWRDQSGAVVVDFLPVFFAMIVLVMIIFEIGIAYFLSLRSFKAAQLGARVAVVLPAVHNDVPTFNAKVNTLGRDGQPCYNPNGADRCDDPGGPWVCDGAALDPACNATTFGLIVNDMRRVFANLEPEAVRVTYIYRGLGETGGAFVPEVNVRITPQEYRFLFFSLGQRTGTIEAKPATQYGSVSASAYGENTSGTTQPQAPQAPGT